MPAKGSAASFLCDQYTKVPPVDQVDLTGKTVIVIGANAGLGLDATKHLATMKPVRLILACRSEERGRAAIKDVREATGFTGAELRLVDLANFASIHDFGTKLEEERLELDFCVYNAGVLPVKHEVSPDGWEFSLQVNDLSAMLLSVLLVPAMLRAASSRPGSHPRIVIVGSYVHYLANIPKDVLNSPNIMRALNEPKNFPTGPSHPRYNQSKLLSLLIVRELANRLSHTPIIVVNPHPGFCHSELGRRMSGLAKVVDTMSKRLVARSTEEGSRELVFAVVGMQGREDELRGAYTNIRKVDEPSDFVISEAGQVAQKRIWNESVQIISSVSPAFRKIVDEYFSVST